MKIQVFSPHYELQNQLTPTLLAELSHRKVELDILPVSSLVKSSQHSGLTKIHYQVLKIERQEDNSLLCKENGRKLPLTPSGGLDKAQLELEIALRLW